MIQIKILNSCDGEIHGFTISGHSGYDEIGKDIVCAAVSSAAYMVANTLTDVLNVDANVCVDDGGRMDVRVSEKNLSECRAIFNGFKLHVILLEEMYPENLKVSYMEV